MGGLMSSPPRIHSPVLLVYESYTEVVVQYDILSPSSNPRIWETDSPQESNDDHAC